MTNIPNLMRHARKMNRRYGPHCWLFRREAMEDLIDHYNGIWEGIGKRMVIDGPLFLCQKPVHIARTDLQYEAMLHYLTEVKGLRVAIRTDEKP